MDAKPVGIETCIQLDSRRKGELTRQPCSHVEPLDAVAESSRLSRFRSLDNDPLLNIGFDDAKNLLVSLDRYVQSA